MRLLDIYILRVKNAEAYISYTIVISGNTICYYNAYWAGTCRTEWHHNDHNFEIFQHKKSAIGDFNADKKNIYSYYKSYIHIFLPRRCTKPL